MLRSSLTPPWSMRIQDEAPLTLVAVVRGSAWLLPDGADIVGLRPGDVAILRGPEHYTVADDPSTPPQVVIHPGQRCTTPTGEEVSLMTFLGVRVWGNSPPHRHISRDSGDQPPASGGAADGARPSRGHLGQPARGLPGR